MPSNSECFSDQSAVNYYKAFINLLRIKCNTYADRVFVRYYSNKAYETLTYADFDRITTNLACKWIKEENLSGVVSYIGDHCVDYLITMVAIMKTRLTLFVISIRNSEAAIVSLLEKTQPKIFFTTPKYKTIVENANIKTCGAKITVIHPFDINAMLKEPLNPQYDKILDIHFSEEDLNQAALIIHSSGSTDFPKPIYVSNRYLINVCGVLSIYKEQNPHVDVIDKDDVILSTGPLFHLAGLFNVCNGIVVGASCVYLERLPPSQTDIDFALRYNKCTALVATPIILEEMVPYLEEKKDLSAVQRLKYIISGGAPLKREVGDWFQDHGVHICSLYGSTEMGVTMLANLDPQSKNWYSVRSIYSGHNEKKYIDFEEEGDGLKQLYVTANCPNLAIDVINRPDGGYNSNDLFEEDPDNPGYYIHRGRRDDILLMENGEKTNPVPMENTIRQSPIVKQVAVLGSGRKCTLALISLDTEYAMDYSPEEMISMVHKAVKEANEECPSHSTILPKMVKILPLNKPLPTTDKGNVMRKRAEMIYRDIVEKTYKEFLEGSVDEPNDSSPSWSSEQIESFLVKNSADVLNLPESSLYNYQGSLFDLGLNSLTAIQLRNVIANYFKDVPRNFLFQHSTLSSMKEALVSKSQEDADVLVEKRYQQTQMLAQSYIDQAAKDFPVAKNKYSTKEKESVVLLTGATGSLGAFILRDLLKDPQVKKVYCLVRGKEAELYDRLINSFKSRHLDTSLLSPERVEALPMRLNEPYLGLSKEYYEQLKDEVTIVQHCAWLLDFNLTIEHYDRECISPFYNLLKFAYRQIDPMHVHFISSVGASAALGPEIEEKPLPFDSHSAMPMGYAQSKFVCEILLNYLTRQKNFPCYIERVGQVSGDSENGVWNTSEQYPMLFVSGGALMRKMPKLSTKIDWIPVDYASAAIVDIMLRTAHFTADEESSIYHIVNPRIESWSDIIDTMRSCGMNFELVDITEWIEALSKDHSLPAFRLLAFYEDSFKSDFSMPYYQTKKTCEMAPVLGQSPIIDSELFKKYLHHWQSVGFYSRSN